MSETPTPQSESREPLFYEKVANQLIEQLKAGTAPWQKPWAAGELQMPHNPVSGHQYKGINVVHLLAQGKDDPITRAPRSWSKPPADP